MLARSPGHQTEWRVALPLVILNLGAWDSQAIKLSHGRLLESL
jgi:hypothetical protein